MAVGSRRAAWTALLLGCVGRTCRADVVWSDDVDTIAKIMAGVNDEPRPCAQVDSSQSNGWTDPGGGKKFSLNVKMDQWVPYAEIVLFWQVPVTIDAIYHAKVQKLRNRGKELHIELEITPSAGNSFVIMGSGTSSIHPEIRCKELMGPPPSPPHSGDCDLGMTYEIKHAFGETEVFDVHFKRWVQTRPITVAFWGQRIDIDSVSNAEMLSSRYADSNTVAKFLLSAPPICVPDGIDTQTGATWKQDCEIFTPSFSFHASPIARRPPHVICHDPWPPPPPPSMPEPPPPVPLPPALPPPSPPPPPAPVALAPSSCLLGGVARVAARLPPRGDHEAIRIIVEPDWWRDGYWVDVGFSGREVEVEHVAHATMMPAVQMTADATKFTFSLQPAAATFTFEAHGMDLMLQSLDCRDPPAGTRAIAPTASTHSSSPPPPRPMDKVATLSSYDAGDSSYSSEADYDSDYDAYGEGGSPTANAALSGGAKSKAPQGPLQRAPDQTGLSTAGPTAALAAGLALLGLAGFLWWRTKARSHQGYGTTTRTNSKVVSAEESVDGMACCSMNVGDTGWEAVTPPSRASTAASAKKEKTWKVSIELDGGLTYQLAVPMSASGAAELKRAIVNECLLNLGDDLTPRSWLVGQLDTMAVQYIGPKGEPKTLKDTSDFASVRGSRVLRVTQRSKHPPIITAGPSSAGPPPTMDITMPPAAAAKISRPLEI